MPAVPPAFEVGACVDLGLFRRDSPDHGVGAWVETTGGAVDWVCLMEDRQPDFFLGYPGGDGTPVPLARHGPQREAWTVRDVRGLVRDLQARGVRVLLGAWMHECAWVDERHPELLMRGADGAVWQDVRQRSADLNPLKRLRADPAQGIAEGTPFAQFLAARWRTLQADLGLDGLFLGDGGMGFRRFARDHEDALHWDFDAAWVREFVAEAAFVPHDGCALLAPASSDAAADARAHAADVRAHHARAWVDWTRERWNAFYRTLADAVHATGGMLAAYNVMNYDPVLAREHGIDYRELAEAGLDVLVFQTYDWAWGPNGPLTPTPNKDAATNVASLLLARARVGHDTSMRIVFTTETSDAVEGWRAPVDVTVREIETYAGARSAHAGAWKPVVDGTFVVWANHVPAGDWRAIAEAWRRAVADPAAPQRGVLVWDDALLDAPHEAGSYAHVKETLGLLPGTPDGVARAEHAVPEPAVPATAPPLARATRRPRRP